MNTKSECDCFNNNLTVKDLNYWSGLKQLWIITCCTPERFLSIFTSFLNKNTKRLFLALLYLIFTTYAFGQSSRLFDVDDVLEFTLSSDLKSVFRDRGDDPQYHPATVKYQAEGSIIAIPLKIKTRGHFRKISGNCQYPPLWLNFAKSTTPKKSVFRGQDKMKLVTPCRGEDYVIHEYLVYKLYNLITPQSLRARLVLVTYHNESKDKSSGPYYGILLEEENQMAKRNKSESIEKMGLNPQHMQKDEFLRMAVFEYMIGNTDWSIQYMQNIKFLVEDSTALPTPVPYDFDHAGIVDAPYAKPAPELKLTSTRQRRYRGYCIQNMEQFAPIFQTFNQLKNEFYAVYQDNPLLSNGYQKQTIKFLDQFFETINDPKKAEEAFTYPCDPSGTGNVIIRGLKEIE